MPPTSHLTVSGALFMAFLTTGITTSAQDAVMSAPSTDLPPAALRESTPTTLSQPPAPTGFFTQMGPLSFHPRLMARSIYALGMPAPEGRRVATMIYSVAPGLRIDMGDRITLDYAPNWRYYTARALQDSRGQAARIQGAWVVKDWAVQLSQGYNESTPLLIETGRPTEQRTWNSNFSASRNFGSKFAFTTTGGRVARYGDSFPDSQDWSTMNWLTIRPSTRFEAGLGYGAGYTAIIREADSYNDRFMGRFNWSPTDKLSLSVDAGLQRRHTWGSDESIESPTYNVSLGFRPFDVTQISLSGSRGMSQSYFERQFTENTGWNLGFQQRLLGRFYFNAGYGRQQVDYQGTSVLVPVFLPDESDPVPVLVSLPGRSDEVESITARLTTTLLQRWTLAASFQRSDHRSNQALFNYTSTQYGFELGLRF